MWRFLAAALTGKKEAGESGKAKSHAGREPKRRTRVDLVLVQGCTSSSERTQPPLTRKRFSCPAVTAAQHWRSQNRGSVTVWSAFCLTVLYSFLLLWPFFLFFPPAAQSNSCCKQFRHDCIRFVLDKPRYGARKKKKEQKSV